MYDLIIKNGRVIDGTGTPYMLTDVAIKDGKIARIAKNLDGAAHVIDASGLTVTPGFIDSHSHADNALLSHPDLPEKIEQGITTSIGGQCGSSPAPLPPNSKGSMIEGLGMSNEICGTFGSFLDTVSKIPMGANTATFMGHGQLRRAVMGSANREPTAEELEKMKELVRDAISHGALGVSFGLIYPPGCYAKTPELIEIAKTVGECGGMIAAHIRNEGAAVVESVEEFITVAREAGVRGVISHHKSSGDGNHGKVKTTLRMIDEANANGTDIWCDVYPYTASHTSLGVTLVPKEYHASEYGGVVKVLTDPELRRKVKEWNLNHRGDSNLDWILIVRCAAYPQYVGKRLNEIAELHGKDVYETAFDMLVDSGNSVGACYFTMCEEDVETVLSHPRAMVCTDSSVAKGASVFHPRLRGTFPRVLGRYERERGIVPLHEMIRKITSMPAAVYGLDTKGLLREGFDADICIFDENKIIDRAEYTAPTLKADGLNYVIMAGEVVVEDAVYNGKRCGKVLLRQ